MNVLLVLPAAEHLRVRVGGKVTRRKMLRFSVLPLTTVAALTPREHRVAICDENVQALDVDAEADVVGISFMTALAPRAYEIAARFRARGKTVVAGGFHPTLCPEEAAEHFDAVVVGDAEGLWPRVLADVEAGRPLGIYRHDGLPDMADTPVPRRDLTAGNARHYATVNAVQTSRGCAHACRYCSVTAFHGHTHRTRPLAAVIEELRGIPRDFMFVDDNIIGDPEYARALFRAMAPLGKRWVSQSSIRIADDPELLALARRAGCQGLFIGVETVSEANLAAVGKEFNGPARYRQRFRAIHRSGIAITAGIIVGMDDDEVGVFERTLRFLQRERIDGLQLNIMTPLPGTPLHEEFERAGRTTDRDWSHYDFRHVVMQPARMTAKQLQDGADWLYSRFYRLDRVLWRFVRGVLTVGPLPALICLKVGLTYRYDNRREGIVGRNPARGRGRQAPSRRLPAS